MKDISSVEISLEQLLEVTGGQLIRPCDPHLKIKQLMTDSRNFFGNPDALFVALKGPHFNGHHFIREVVAKGGKMFLVSDEINVSDTGLAIIKVADTLEAMQQVAAYKRSLFSYPVLGITGSNGKTIVKEWLSQLLNQDYKIVRSPKSFNSQVGVALSVWNMEAQHTLGIFEAGISRPGEMKRLEKIIRPTIGVFTNIGSAHDANFIHRKQKTLEKLELFRHCHQLIYCKDQELVQQTIEEQEEPKPQTYFSWSRKSNADLLITRISRNFGKTVIQAIYRNNFISITIPFTDEASVENSITCWSVMLCLGIDEETIAERMNSLLPVAMRLEIRQGINNCFIINDTYNSDWESFFIALEYLKKQNQQESKTIILSDFSETGKAEEDLYHEVAKLLRQSDIKKIYGIGKSISQFQHLFDVPVAVFDSTIDFLSQFRASWFKDEVILVKGSRQYGFEKISQRLQQKAHETILEINLDALVQNVSYFRSILHPGVKMMAVVKAFGYGTGSSEIARVLQQKNIDYLAVAYADEGVELRTSGIYLPIMVMNPSPGDIDNMLEYNLEPEVYNFRTLHYLKEAMTASMQSSGFLKIHLKLDTGMHRLGFEESELEDLIRALLKERRLKVTSVFSHLVASEDPAQDEYTRQQFRLFTKMTEKLREYLEEPFLRHILNSGGISRFPEGQFEMVRLGIGMHGISGVKEDEPFLQPTATLRTVISQIRKVKAGDSVGYGRKFFLENDTVIATVPIGYADGYSRKFGNGNGSMLVNGHKVKTVGNICMDMTMLDITNINTDEGDEVIVFGAGNSVNELASSLQTIPYEVLSGVSARVKRVYYHE